MTSTIKTTLFGLIASSAAFGLLAATPARAQLLEAAGGLTFYKEVVEPNAQLIKTRPGHDQVRGATPAGYLPVVEGKAKAASRSTR